MPDIVKLDMDTPSVQYLCRKCKRIAKVIEMVGPIQYTPHKEDAYSFLIHEIIEQMLSVKAGHKIYSRLEELCGGYVSPDRICSLTDEQIRSTGTSNAKIEYIRNVTNAITGGTLNFEAMQQLSDNEIIATLTKIRGIGNWTAKMYLMFVLDRQDILPVEDGAFLQVYRWMYKTQNCSEKAVTAKCKKWKPYSSVASRFCYKALDAGMTKEEFHLFK